MENADIGHGEKGSERDAMELPAHENRPVPDMRELPDAALVLRVRADSSDALATLYRRHGEMVYHVAYRFLASADDAQDILQDVFAGLPEALRTYEERGKFAAWLKRIAVRASLMMLRSRSRRREERLPEGDVLGSTGGPAEVTDLVATRRAIALLSEEQRVVLMLKQVEGYSHAEIAKLLGISEGASAARLHRALRTLWKLLGEPRGRR